MHNTNQQRKKPQMDRAKIKINFQTCFSTLFTVWRNKEDTSSLPVWWFIMTGWSQSKWKNFKKSCATRTHTHVRAHMHTHTHTHIYTHIHTAQVCVCTHVHTHTYTHTYTHTHTHTHTQTHTHRTGTASGVNTATYPHRRAFCEHIRVLHWVLIVSTLKRKRLLLQEGTLGASIHTPR